jgi:glycosyltransferase involved in cell wall biosynthesis
MYTPYLAAHGYETMLAIANCKESQLAWARENGLEHVHPDLWMYQITISQVNVFKPDILYLSHPIEFESKFIRALSWKPKLIMGWRAAAIPNGIDFSEFDLILSSDAVTKRRAKEVGAKAVEHFVPGFPTLVLDSIQDQEPIYDVVFSGQWGPEHLRRNSFLEAITHLAKATGISVAFFLHNHSHLPASQFVDQFNHGARWGIEMYRALRQGRIVFNAIIDFGKGEAGNMRQFEATGCGAMLVTEHHDTVSQYFEPERELVTYKDARELCEKILFYVSNPEERKRIAEQGHKRCLSHHSMERRASEFHEIIQRYLNKSCKTVPEIVASGNHPSTAHHAKNQPDIERTDKEQDLNAGNELLNNALALMKNGRLPEAFELTRIAKEKAGCLRDLHLIQALCFCQKGDLVGAQDALAEELRLFPENQQAHELLTQLLQGSS